MSVLAKLEPDATQAGEVHQLVDLAVKHRLPALVVHQALYPEANFQRIRRRGQFRLVVSIDPRGESRGGLKFRGVSHACLQAGGFEVTLSPGLSEVEARAEADELGRLVRAINPGAEVRFVLGASSRDEQQYLNSCRGLVGVCNPTLVRTDTALKLQVSKGSVEAHTRVAQRLREIIGHPLKASGNFSTAISVLNCPWAARFAVSLSQLQQIIQDLERRPDGLREVLAQ